MKNKEVLNVMCITFGTCGALIIYASAFLGVNSNSIYFWGFVLAAPFIWSAFMLFNKLKFIKNVEELRKNWGKENTAKREMKLISNFYKFINHNDENKFYIDDQTWEDLVMDEIYKKVDRTITTPGEEVLYSILRSPFIKGDGLKERNEQIKELQKNEELRQKVQSYLLAMGKQKGNLVSSLIWDGHYVEKPKMAFVFNILAFLAVASLISVAFVGPKALVEFVIPIFIINIGIHYKIKEDIKVDIMSLKYLSSLVGNAKCIADTLKGTKLNDLALNLNSNYQKCKNIAKKGGTLITDTGTADPFKEYFSILFLVEVRSYFAVVDKIKKYNNELKEIYTTIGMIDSYISVASYRKGLKSYVEPEIVNGEALLDIENVWHPLIDGAVPNSIKIEKEGIIITGANMSGKSTFLRTVGVNALFAQTISTCLSTSYKGGYLRIMTSISRADNILGGKSYYLAEAEALLRIINCSGKDVPLFCMIDEIFRGTNSVERIAASAEILKYLVDNNTIVIVATHDIELVNLIGDKYRYFYFTEDMNEEGLKFDYKIREGVSQNRNAIRIMKYLGYPDEIIDRTNKRISML